MSRKVVMMDLSGRGGEEDRSGVQDNLKEKGLIGEEVQGRAASRRLVGNVNLI